MAHRTLALSLRRLLVIVFIASGVAVGCGGGDEGVGTVGVCSSYDARGEGSCDKLLGVYFNGYTCYAVGGCDCVGEDCGLLYPSFEECEAATAECTPCADPLAPGC